MKDYPRAARVSAQLHQELPALVRELTDPRVAKVNVTGVDVTHDMRNANVRVSMFGDDDETLKIAVKALNGAAGRLHRALTARLRMRYVPVLHFQGDWGLRQGDHVQGLIRQAVRRDAAAKRAAPDAIQAPAPGAVPSVDGTTDHSADPGIDRKSPDAE
jgi:ribosome-binding factor A